MSHVDAFGEFHAENDGRSAQVIQIENGKQTNTVVICAVLCAICACIAVYALGVAKSSETETRMLEYYVNRLTNEAIAAGIHQNGDDYQQEKQNGTR